MPAPKGNQHAKEANIGNKNAAKPEKEKKTENILLRLTKAEKEQIQANAKTAGFNNISKFILSKIL